MYWALYINYIFVLVDIFSFYFFRHSFTLDLGWPVTQYTVLVGFEIVAKLLIQPLECWDFRLA